MSHPFRFDKVQELVRLIEYFKREKIEVSFVNGPGGATMVWNDQAGLVISKDEIKVAIDLNDLEEKIERDKKAKPMKGRKILDDDFEQDIEEDDDDEDYVEEEDDDDEG